MTNQRKSITENPDLEIAQAIEDAEIEDETEAEEPIGDLRRKRNYKIEKFTLDVNNVNNFTIIEDRRQINEGHVSRIHGVLIKNGNPIGVLIVNRRDGQDRLIDGNHRIEAAKSFFSVKKNAEIKVECILKVYENLTPNEEREVYENEAKRRNESIDDRLNMFKSTLQIWKSLTDPLRGFPVPVSIYPATSTLKFKMLLNAIATARRGDDMEFNAVGLDRDNILNLARDVLDDEFVTLKEFMEMFLKVFGTVEKTNYFAKPHYFIPLFDIYARNQKYKKEYPKRFARLIGHQDLMSYINLGTRVATINIRELMIKHINKGCSSREFT